MSQRDLQTFNWIATTENPAPEKVKKLKDQFFFSTWSTQDKLPFVRKYIWPVTQKQFTWLNKKDESF